MEMYLFIFLPLGTERNAEDKQICKLGSPKNT